MLPRLGDLLFYTIAEGQERIPIHKFTTVSGRVPVERTLVPSGLWDPRRGWLNSARRLMAAAEGWEIQG